MKSSFSAIQLDGLIEFDCDDTDHGVHVAYWDVYEQGSGH